MKPFGCIYLWHNLLCLKLAAVRWLGLAVVLACGEAMATNPMPVLAEPAPFDVLERNVVLDEEGREIFHQWLVWTVQDDGQWTCEGWRLIKPSDTYRPWGKPRVVLWEEGVVLRGAVFIERAIVGDVEFENRTHWPVERRRDFRRSK
jgi:hypothetical protein